ncbi:hypothetical protein V491_08865, partial [Pseudogymnoascus sp. VKM F-3775]
CWDHKDSTTTGGSNQPAGGDGGFDNKGAERGVEASDELSGLGRTDTNSDDFIASAGRKESPNAGTISKA